MSRRGPLVERAAVALGVAGLTVLYALRGGSFDVVPRQEAGIAIWLVLALGFAAGVLPRERLSRPALLIVIAFGLLIAWTAASLGWTESAERTYTELARAVHHLGIVLLVVCLLTRRTWTAAAGGLLAGCAAVCALAVASRLWPGSFPHDPVRGAFGGNRLNYPLNYWNAVATWGTVTATMALAWSAHAARPWTRAAALAVVPLAATMTYLTYSRQGLVGMAIGLLAVWALARHRALTLLHAAAAAGVSALAIHAVRSHRAIADALGGAGGNAVLAAVALAALACAALAALTFWLRLDRRARMPRRLGRWLIAAGVVVAAAGVAATARPAISKGWREFRNQDVVQLGAADPAARLTSLNGNRYNLWKSALDAFDSRPLQGRGAGTYGFWWARNGANPERVLDAHSFPLETLAELGAVGAAIVVYLLIGVVFAGVESLRAATAPTDRAATTALFAALLVGAFHMSVDWIWESTAAMALLLVAAAALARGGAERPPARVRALPRAILFVVCALACLALVPNLASVSKIRDSQRLARAGQLAAAGAAATDAVSAEPWASTPYLQRALVSEQAGQLAAALGDAREAARREPTNWRPLLVQARIEARLGHAAQALRTWEQARRYLRFPGLVG